MFTDDFDELSTEFFDHGKPTLVVNQVINDEGHIYRVPIGNGWVEGQFSGRIELTTIVGDFEVVPYAPALPARAEQVMPKPSSTPHSACDDEPTIH